MPPAHADSLPWPKRWVSIALAAFMGVVLFTGTAGGILYSDLIGKMNKSVVSTDKFRTSKGKTPKDSSPVDGFKGRAVNILVMGTDARVNANQTFVPGDEDTTMRADTQMIMHISADRKAVTMVSLPRDQWLLLPECNLPGGGVSPANWGQFNWAFEQGSGGSTDQEAMAGAIACAQQNVEDLTGITLDGYAVFDFNGFANMVQALGGVEICLDKEIDDDEYLGMVFPAGCQHMDPITATQFARVRHTENSGGDGSDMERIQRQQKLVGAIVRQALSTNLLTELPSLYQFVTATLSATVISPSFADVNEDIALMRSLSGIDPQNIRFVTMPVLTADFSAYRLVPKQPQAHELWMSLMNSTPLPPGTVYQNLNAEFFTVQPDGTSLPGGSPRTDDGFGGYPCWDVWRYVDAFGGTTVEANMPYWMPDPVQKDYYGCDADHASDPYGIKDLINSVGSSQSGSSIGSSSGN